jgi:hypothetical protein
VINPNVQSENALRDWDLWGPFLLCLLLAILLSISAPPGQAAQLFTGVFTIVTFGAIIATCNIMLLGSSVEFFQGICALGYCLFPIAAAAIIAILLPWLLIRILTVPPALVWSITSLSRFFGTQIPADRKVLGMYPCGLMYTILAWIVFLH